MNRTTSSLLLLLTLTTPARCQCPGGFCRPAEQRIVASSPTLALDSPLSTLDSSPHCRIHVGDGTVGSGTLISKNDATGLVLTCSHLFDDATSNIVVEFHDGRRFGGRLIDRDVANDLAAILVRRPDAEPLTVEEGEPAGVLTACGYGGNGQFRPASGPISGAAQAVGATFPSLKIVSTVRPGDSGGGVLNRAGHLVGVVWGCRDGETYLTCGRPLREFLDRVWPNRPRGERAPAHGPNNASPSTTPTEPTMDWQAWRDEFDSRLATLDSRLATLDAKKQDRGDYLQVGDLNAYARISETRAAATQAEQASASRLESLRTAVYARIEQRIGELEPGLLSGLSFGKIAAGALGLSGPVALAVIIAGGLAGRRIKHRVASASNSQPSTLNSQPFPIAVDSPPPPQKTVPESHYVPVERDDFARAHQWAREQVARKYPGATEMLSTLESLIKQQLAAN